MRYWSASRANCPEPNHNHDDIFESFQLGAAELGYKYCSILLLPTDAPSAAPLLSKNSFPNTWNQHFTQHYDYRDVPIVRHCQACVLPSLWSESLFISLPRLWEDLCLFGLQHGFSHAVHDPRGLTSIFCFTREQPAINHEDFYEKAGFMLWLTNKTHTVLAERLFLAPPPVRLTPKELEVLRWTAEGKTAEEVAIILSLSRRTVGFHIHSIICKLGVRNKTAAVTQAVRRKLI
ncbi:autoinducer binding domain-containing protein [Pseudomonas mucidolens]|uniref:LuxR family transcriptional regulator n=1 Tax=Pseudomonas mucidolens TaxID=46679 RepID=A0A1H2MLG3_9PSED|nr:autoinducer binding domain-containing protein [Pseudomonas mucidolens]SDU93865.1 LuxR family transcriptional regulator [Pseudomonas mucidolens]SQH33665.1 putative LuxR family regulatory protein [Pseudomonas mucidolens]